MFPVDGADGPWQVPGDAAGAGALGVGGVCAPDRVQQCRRGDLGAAGPHGQAEEHSQDPAG